MCLGKSCHKFFEILCTGLALPAITALWLDKTGLDLSFNNVILFSGMLTYRTLLYLDNCRAMFLQLLPISVYHGCRPIIIMSLFFNTLMRQFNSNLNTAQKYAVRERRLTMFYNGFKKPSKRVFLCLAVTNYTHILIYLNIFI